MTGIDLFAGLGGWSEGARRAGLRIVWAGNHWQAACDIYELNHGLKPKCQDLQQAKWHEVPRCDIVLASSACQGHTKARGVDRPHHDEARCTAWAVVSAVEALRPAAFVNENVVEFHEWELYGAWCLAMQMLGYTLSTHVIDAADHGVPQNRVRVFDVGTRSRAPLRLSLPSRPHVPAADIIERVGEWSPVRAMCPNTRARIAAGRRAHGRRFLIAYYGSSRGGRSLSRPLGTLTTRDRFAIVDGDRMRMLSVDECREGMSFPADYRLPASSKLAKHLLGNAVPPTVGADIIDALKTQL